MNYTIGEAVSLGQLLVWEYSRYTFKQLHPILKRTANSDPISPALSCKKVCYDNPDHAASLRPACAYSACTKWPDSGSNDWWQSGHTAWRMLPVKSTMGALLQQ